MLGGLAIRKSEVIPLRGQSTLNEVLIGTKLSSDESRRAMEIETRYWRRRRLYQLVLWLIVVLPGTVASIFWISGAERSTLQSIVQVSLPWIGGLLLLRAITWRQARRGVAVWYADANVPHSLHIVARPEGIKVTWEGFECIQSWHQFDVIHDAEEVLLCRNARLPILIAKRLQTRDEIAAILGWLRSAVPNRIRE